MIACPAVYFPGAFKAAFQGEVHQIAIPHLFQRSGRSSCALLAAATTLSTFSPKPEPLLE